MKMYYLEETDLEKVRNLFKLKQDGTFYVLTSANGFSDIVQYSSKYQNVHIVAVPTNRLDFSNCLGTNTKAY